MVDSFLTLLDAKGKLLVSDDDAKWTGPLNRDSQIRFTFQEAGVHWIKVSSLYRRGSPDHVYRLTIEPQQPDFLLSLKSDRATVSRGKGKVAVTLRRSGDFKGDVSVEAAGLPNGVAAKRLTLENEKRIWQPGIRVRCRLFIGTDSRSGFWCSQNRRKRSAAQSRLAAGTTPGQRSGLRQFLAVWAVSGCG